MLIILHLRKTVRILKEKQKPFSAIMSIGSAIFRFWNKCKLEIILIFVINKNPSRIDIHAKTRPEVVDVIFGQRRLTTIVISKKRTNDLTFLKLVRWLWIRYRDTIEIYIWGEHVIHMPRLIEHSSSLSLNTFSIILKVELEWTFTKTD